MFTHSVHSKKGNNMSAVIAPKTDNISVPFVENRAKIINKCKMMNSNEWTWVFWGLEGAQSVCCAIVCVCVCVGGGLFNLCVTPPKFLACSRCDKVSFRRQPADRWQYNFPFYSSACAPPCRWSSLYKSCVHPFVSAQPPLPSNCSHGEQIDWALSLILRLGCRSEVSGWMRHNGSRRLRPITEHQKLQPGDRRERSLTQFCNAPVANTVTV